MTAIRKEIANAEVETARTLQAELREIADVGRWYSEQLPVATGEAVARAAAATDQLLGSAVASELTWARESLVAAGIEVAPEIKLAPPAVTDLPALLLPENRAERLRFLAQLSKVVLEVLGPILSTVAQAPVRGLDRLPELALAPSIRAAEQITREQARRGLTNYVRQALSQVADDGEARLHAFYSELFTLLDGELEQRYVSARSRLELTDDGLAYLTRADSELQEINSTLAELGTAR